MRGASRGDPRRSGPLHAARIRRSLVNVPSRRYNHQPARPFGVHAHRCIGCKGTYACNNACDPFGEGLKNSICDGCFEEVSKK